MHHTIPGTLELTLGRIIVKSSLPLLNFSELFPNLTNFSVRMNLNNIDIFSNSRVADREWDMKAQGVLGKECAGPPYRES